METIIINNTKFEDNTALEGTDAYLYDSKYNITNSYFTGNIQSMFDGNMTILKNGYVENLCSSDYIKEPSKIYFSNPYFFAPPKFRV